MKSFYCVLLASSFVAISLAAEKCDPHAKYQECGGCQPTCQDPFPVCDRSYCRPAGCYCVPPFVMEKGECIIPTDCEEYKNHCKRYETYDEKGDCEGSCADPDPQFCTRFGLGPGCYCLAPYVRENGKCIHREQCPQP